MADVSSGAATAQSVAPNKGVKQGLPTLGLQEAETVAKKLWEAARGTEVSKQLFAQQMGTTTSSSHFKARIALVRGLGVFSGKGVTVQLSPLGLDLVQDHDEERLRLARVKAMQTLKSWRELIDDYAGTPLPSESILTGRLKFDYGKSDEVAKDAVNAFIESMHYAQMIDASGVVHMNGAFSSATPAVEEPLVEEGAVDAASEAAEELDDATEEIAAGGDHLDPEYVAPGQPPAQQVGAPASPRSEVSLHVTLDLSDFEADEVIRILQALGVAKRD